MLDVHPGKTKLAITSDLWQALIEIAAICGCSQTTEVSTTVQGLTGAAVADGASSRAEI